MFLAYLSLNHFYPISNCGKAYKLVELAVSISTKKQLELLKSPDCGKYRLPEGINDPHQARVYYLEMARKKCSKKNTGALFFLSLEYLYYFKDLDKAEEVLRENYDKWPNRDTLIMLIQLYREKKDNDMLEWTKKEREKFE